ncbi:phage portal protein [Candidatus Stoquefichus massiliensis]|uniref:phage portal protein n=1 Tax=Candidatus Stoquefichus massiliensis TaxID=1470350 RepID=UPI000486ECCE|nr:phage portal protein [Candidatus Stoquefichus massiliensis]
MYTFTVDGSIYDETQLNKTQIEQLIRKHNNIASKFRKNMRYYEADHAIKGRKKKNKKAANNKVVCNHAKDISDTATGFFMNSPISYGVYDKEDTAGIDRLTDAFDTADTDDVDSDNAHDMSVCGVAYEYVYVKEDTTDLLVRNIEADHTFLVYDDTIEQNLLFGVYYYRFKDSITEKFCYRATVVTKTYIYNMILECNGNNHQDISEPYENHLGNVPIVEYRNNKLCIGDFEQQISLIDAYNKITSDRVNDKEQFVEALLVIYGSLLGDDNEEVSEAMKILKENGLLELPLDARAEYIARTFDETGIEVLRKAIKEDIYTFSHVPNLTDENFVGNSSGVAMEYKLLGLQMITGEKEKYYKKGLKRRIELFCNFLKLKAISVNPNMVKITFTRELPKNLNELAQMIANLSGKVSNETLIEQLPFVEDAAGEVEKVKKENDDNVRRQQQMFKFENDKPFREDEEDEDTSEDTSASDKNSKLDSSKNH